MKKIEFEGLLMPSIITPMKKNGKIDFDGLKENVEFY